MRLVALLFAAILSGPAYSQTNFGDKVVACVASKTTANPPNSEIQAAFKACGSQFDAAVAASLQPDQGQAARVGFSVAADTNPDYEAELKQVARRTGVPVDTVLNMPKEMKRQDAVGSIDFDTLAKTSPATASLLADVEKAKIAHDDVDDVKRFIPALVALAAISALALAGYFLRGPIKRLSARAFSSQTARRFIVLHAAWVTGLVFLSAALPSVMERFGLGFDGDRDTNHTLALAFITPWLVLAFWKSWKWATNSTKQEI